MSGTVVVSAGTVVSGSGVSVMFPFSASVGGSRGAVLGGA